MNYMSCTTKQISKIISDIWIVFDTINHFLKWPLSKFQPKYPLQSAVSDPAKVLDSYLREPSSSCSKIIPLQNVRQQTRSWYSHNALKIDAQACMTRARLLCAPYRTMAAHYPSPHAFYSYPEQSIYTQVNIKPSKTIEVPLKAWWLLK